ncbi:tRNA lysidine(34) synthetase TilS [Pseudocitrobacter cyperus]|uniref:tRNA(Ile)-lysidine synthase n=1 Tax=Pseudocitrobacter cyperus TaxID=3112843 RepID=A0ABV0HK35_9ENTR
MTTISSLSPQRQFLVAFSGGLDSTVLLHQLVCWRQREPSVALRAIHIHHGLSTHADAWVEHCRQQCEAWNVPLQVEYVKLAQNGLGIEAHARQARYQVFSDALRAGEALVTAQHLDDQCETFLLALKRGSGPAGLSSMPARMPFADGFLVRPLLNETRASLLAWAKNHHLSWIEDESNQDDAYDRNFLRLRVVPLLTERWPHFAQATARSAALCGEQEQLLDELLADELANLMTPEGALELGPMQSMSEPRRAALLRRWLASHHAAMPSRDMLARIWQEVALAREDASPCLRHGEYEIRRYQQRLWWVKTLVSPGDSPIYWPDITRPLTLSFGSLSVVSGGDIRPPHENETVSIRFKASGTLHIVGRNGGRKLKKIWQELGVPPWLRDTTPLLFYNDILIAAAGRFITQEGAVTPGAGLRLEWEKTGS